METRRPDVMYLSTTDYVRTSTRPHAGRRRLLRMMDGYHRAASTRSAPPRAHRRPRMNAKTDAAGRPQVVYLQDVLDAWLGAGAPA